MAEEQKLENFLIRQAKKRDILCYKFKSPSHAGVPDRILIKHGHIIFLELKAPGQTPRPLQAVTIKKIRKHGGDALWSSDQDEITDLLDGLLTRKPIVYPDLQAQIDAVTWDKSKNPDTRPEHRIEQRLIDRAKKLDILCYKFTSPSRAGVPDRLVIANNKTIFIELKAPGKKPRPQQIERHKEMAAHGARPVIIDTLDRVDKILEYMAIPAEG